MISRDGRTRPSHLTLVVAVLLYSALALAAEQEFRYRTGESPVISVHNPFGSVTLRSSHAGEVVVRTKASSHAVVRTEQRGRRIDVRTQASAQAQPEQARVDYNIEVPPQATVSVHSSTAAIRAEGLRGDLILESASGPIEVRDYADSHLLVRGIGSAINIAAVHAGHVEVSSLAGNVLLTDVSGARVSVRTTTGRIEFDGGFAAEGDYSVTTHSGNIEVAMPQDSSVEVTAHSIKGRVEDEFQFQPQEDPAISFTQGQWFAGSAGAGVRRGGAAAAVRLQSFSGTIRVSRR